MSTVYVDVVEAGKGLVTVLGYGGTILRVGQRYRVEDERGELVGYARSYRVGGEMLARSLGVDVSGVEVEQEWKRSK